MQKTVEKLLIIQERDQKIRELNKELERLPAEEEQARARLAGDTAAVEAARKAIQENEIAMKNFELDIDTRKDTIAKLKTQQFETRKNEEFTALGDEITRYGDEVTALEDSELELAVQRDLKSVHYIGPYCSQEVLFFHRMLLKRVIKSAYPQTDGQR